jgi:hypothetical protein
MRLEIANARAVPVADEIARRGIKMRRAGRELVGPCPVCGGTDRFSVNPNKGVFNCRGCQTGGDVIALVQHLDGVDFREAVSRLTGASPRQAAQQVQLESRPSYALSDNRQRALDIWRRAVPIAGSIAERYLIETRKLVLPPDVSPQVLRFHHACPFEGAAHPCLLALYRDIVTDKPMAIMRTALTSDARKIKRAAFGPVAGASIKITDNADVAQGLTIGEGLETVLAGMMKGFSPAWALGSAGGIAKFAMLANVEALTILAETDDSCANARAVAECGDRWSAAGREVYRVEPLIGGDLNDVVLMEA